MGDVDRSDAKRALAMNRELRFGVVLLAAGASTRMGRPKLLLPWGPTTVLGHLIDGWRALGVSRIAAVLAAGDTVVSGELDRLAGMAAEVQRVINPDPARGMFSSIQAAAGWAGCRPESSVTHWLVSLGDQPHVRQETWLRLLTEAGAHPDRICQPARHGRARHPVAMPAACFREVATARDATLKDFLAARSSQRLTFESDDPGLDLDLDFPEDYELALRIAGFA